MTCNPINEPTRASQGRPDALTAVADAGRGQFPVYAPHMFGR